ncbi:MAG: MotA/TolQ/ExbB proton channel family protein [Erythrobacter sp.]
MPSDWMQFFDPGALAIVLAGTFLATAARCGWSDLRVAGAALLNVRGRAIDETSNRAALARLLKDINRAGPLCTDHPAPPDPALARPVAAYLRSGSADALHVQRRADRAKREMLRGAAVRAFEYAGELAPVFGLVGTLYAITQIAPGAGEESAVATLGAIGTAVMSSLYGVLIAHLLCIPIARAIERQSEREETVHNTLLDWFISELPQDKPLALASVRGAA